MCARAQGQKAPPPPWYGPKPSPPPPSKIVKILWKY